LKYILNDRLPVSPQKRCIFHVSVQPSSSCENEEEEEGENMIEENQQKQPPSHNLPCPLVVDTNGMYFR